MNGRIGLASMVAAALCILTGAVLAYSDEAIADAESLFKSTAARITVREVTPQDLSVVRYYLLELRLAAGKLTPEAFCQQARAELQTMIAAQGDEETKAGLEQRADKVAAMKTSPELCRQGIAAIDSYLFGIGEPAKSEADVHEAERALADARTKYRIGEVDRVTVARAEADAFEAQYTSGKLTRAAYCASGQAESLANLTGWIQQLAQLRQAGLLGQIAAKRRFYEFKALCQAK